MTNFRDSLTFRNYDRERIIIDSIAARLTAEENAFRNRIINSIADTRRAFLPADGEERRLSISRPVLQCILPTDSLITPWPMGVAQYLLDTHHYSDRKSVV